MVGKCILADGLGNTGGKVVNSGICMLMMVVKDDHQGRAQGALSSQGGLCCGR